MEVDLNEENQPEKVTAPEVVTELEKEQVSKTESKTNVIMTVGDGSAVPGQNMTAMTVAVTSSASAGQHKPSPRVRIKIEYPKGWKGVKHFADGSIRDVAPETADQFIQLGMASIVKQDKPE